MPEPIIIAHRGASGSYPENTLLAFGQALDAGATWVELDVQVVDDALLVFHDDCLERTTNGKGPLAQMSLAELRALDAGCGERIPLLEEVLTLCQGRAQVNIELKGEQSAAPTAALLQRLFAEGRLQPLDILASLRLEELENFQRLLPEVRRAPIFEFMPEDLKAQIMHFSAWSIHLHKSLITEEVIQISQQQNCRVFAWTVNSLKTFKSLKNKGTQGLFTDHPARFIRKK